MLEASGTYTAKLSKRQKKIEKYQKNREFKQLYDEGLRVAERLGLECSAESFNPRGSKLRNSQNSLSDSTKPVRRPLTWVPPCGVGIRLT